jgi:hypothetical protein
VIAEVSIDWRLSYAQVCKFNRIKVFGELFFSSLGVVVSSRVWQDHGLWRDIALVAILRRANHARVREIGDTHGVTVVDVERGSDWVDAKRWRMLSAGEGGPPSSEERESVCV